MIDFTCFSQPYFRSLPFYQQEGHTPPADLIRILHTSYRNSPEITKVANRILKLKNVRFGSIDRESHYLVHSHAHQSGTVLLLPVIRR